MSQQSNCRIWGTHAVVEPRTGHFEIVLSPRAGGKYCITDRATAILVHRDEHLKARLTSWLIAQRRLGVESPRISSVSIREGERQRSLTVHQRADNLLRYIHILTPHIGSLLRVNAHESNEDYLGMLAWSESVKFDELIYLIDYLVSLDRLERIHGGQFRLTVNGYSHLAELQNRVSVSSRVFVAMWFDESMVSAWEMGISRGIEDAGYEAVRIDQKEHVNRIDDEIIAEIRRSRFVVADFTHGSDGSRGGVYYEAGFAHGLDLPVIFTCHQDALDQVHFDTRQYNHIVWETPEELRDKLSKRIAAVIGDGPFKDIDSL